MPGEPSTPADEADAALRLSLTDVRAKADLSDYAGELEARLTLRLTDRDSGPTLTELGTMVDRPFSFTASCTTTPGNTTTGSTCGVMTTADAVMPGAIKEGERAIWQLEGVEVYDGGADGDVDTAPNTLFMRQGVFIP